MIWLRTLALTLVALLLTERYIRQPSKPRAFSECDWFTLHSNGGGV